jgi:hypothetical protein
LREITVDAAQSGRHVYPLAFHVDYWNDLGWRDPFSSDLATSHQRAYAQLFGEHSVYTPQMIINGRDAFVGSDRKRALQSIESALGQPSVARIELRRATEPDAIAVDYTVAAASPGTHLRAALIERQAVSTVTSGENAGRTLHHANVVRAFSTVSIDDRMNGHIAFPGRRVEPGRYAVVAYLQDPQTLRITAGGRLDL